VKGGRREYKIAPAAHHRQRHPLPLPAKPQHRLLTVDTAQIPLLKDLVAPGIHIAPLRLGSERGE
jgi:hypothetical protein